MEIYRWYNVFTTFTNAGSMLLTFATLIQRFTTLEQRCYNVYNVGIMLIEVEIRKCVKTTFVKCFSYVFWLESNVRLMVFSVHKKVDAMPQPNVVPTKVKRSHNVGET